MASLIIHTVNATERLFANRSGETLSDTIIKFNFDKQEVLFEKNGRIPLEVFHENDQAYILQWNQQNGFASTMRFKIQIERDRWARMKHEQTRTPAYIEAARRPHFNTLLHNTALLEAYEAYSAISLEALGFSLHMRNQNFFPLENIRVDSKIIYEEQSYLTSDSMYASAQDLFDQLQTEQRIRTRSEEIAILVPLEEIKLHSATAILSEHTLDRSNLESSSEENEDTSSIDGLGDWSDHNRDRKDAFIGVWFRIGIPSPDGDYYWRHMSIPDDFHETHLWDEL
jgi:hypothetical protein